MASWGEIEASAPELSAAARRCFDGHRHLTLATLRRDGSPRISGTEVELADGEMWLGSMPRSVKALDLQRDPRFALHSGSDDPPGWEADAKVAGRAEEVIGSQPTGAANRSDAPSGAPHRFRLDITELVVVRIGEPADHIVIESWHEGRGITKRRR